MKRFLVLAILLPACISAVAQKENYNWTFGNYAGLTWNTTQSYPAVDIFGISGGDITLSDVPTSFEAAINTQEGCFSVSSDDGDLLFYSDGRTIWNSNHQVMPNGTGLTGNASSTQSGIIIPRPGHGGQYIAVTLGIEQSNKMAYSIIDMSLDGGLGDVVDSRKDILFTGQSGHLGESVTAVRHSNKSDFWIIAVGRTSANTWLNVWLVDKDSVHTVARSASTVALNKIAGQYMTGYLAFNKSGTAFWYNSWSPPSGNSAFYAFGTFDPATGTFSQVKIRENGDTSIATRALYGAAFSSSGQYVYTTIINGSEGASGESTLNVYDFNALMAAATPTSVAPLKTLVSPSSSTAVQDGTNNHFGAVGRGPGNRIYIADAFGKGLFVIPDPDDDPTNLKIYKLENILTYSTVGSGGWGLPSSTGFYFNVALRQPPPHIPVCVGKDTDFKLSISGGEGGDDFSKVVIHWGDGTPDTTVNSPLVNSIYDVSHTYRHRNTYTIEVHCFDASNNEITALYSEQSVKVNSGKLIANPNIRGTLVNNSRE
ncbi:MAG: hypothetical protein LBR64_04015 [Dysgonamonadaceae bacterium]|jgi:hypothetical protein|nr:hypothetical protein [Dysgonamonadaceae bacterium]